LPRDRDNTRVKDLPDLALLATAGPLEATELRDALVATFEFRGTHPLPASLPEPPSGWEPVYSRMAAKDDLRWRTLAEVFEAVRDFLNPILRTAEAGGANDAAWHPSSWSWR